MNRQGSNIPWWAIVLGFIFFPPVGMILLLLNLGGVRLGGTTTRANLNNNLKQNTTGRATYTSASSTERQSAGATQTGQYNAQPSTGKAQAKPGLLSTLSRAIDKNIRSGRLMTILGGIASFFFSIGFVDEVGTYGFTWVEDWFPLLGFTLAGLVTAGFGIARTRLGRRQRLYLGAIGNKKSIFLSDLAAAAGVSEKKVVADLQKMLSDGTLPMGYIDRASGRLVLTDQGYEHVERSQPKEEETTATVRQEATQEDKDRAILLQIRAINDAIPGDEMSRKIDRIEEITGKILSYARSHPKKSGELRQFLNYYLPTTLKILNAYAQMDAQGVEGENITAAKARIEGMMDKVVDGFEKQLDQLFQSDAMDITTDVEVLERMLEKDGLGSNDITLTLNPTGSYQRRSQTGSAAAAATATEDISE